MRLLLLVGILLMPGRALAQPEPVDTAAIQRIRSEAHTGSQVMEYAFQLSESFGSRMTGSPSFRAAGTWAAGILEEIGVEVHMEPIDWGRGWSASHSSLDLVAPHALNLVASAVPWSAGSSGSVEGTALLVPLPGWETPDVYRAFFDTWRGWLHGRVILATREIPDDQPPSNELIPRRLTNEELSERIRRQEQASRGADAGGGEGDVYDPELFSSAEFFAWQDSLYGFLHQEGVIAILYGSSGRGGTVHLNGPMRLQPAWLRHPKHVLPPPIFAVGSEHYNHLLRLLRVGKPVRLRVELETVVTEDPRNAYNLVGEIRGTDKRSELVMLGAHLDAWPLATGATDNAAGSAVVMEAMRILAALDLPLRRTVRMVLWGGHEGEGLGSRTYIQQHFDAGYPTTWLEQDERGTRHDPRPAYDSLSAYFNLDYLAGRIRGVFLQENEGARPIFHAWLKPFAHEGANHISGIVAGGSDHMAFEDVGLPGFPFIQDGPEHDVVTHHSNMDVFDYLNQDDLKQSAIILAAIVYHAAMREEKLPRKPTRPVD